MTSRYETVDWSTFSDHGSVTLGDLRRVLREVSDWPDDAPVDCRGVVIRRPLPLLTPDA
jgi:hypothetical protein